MDTLKTAAVVILLLAVLYGVYVVLNRPGNSDVPDGLGLAPGEGASLKPLEIDVGIPAPPGAISGAKGSDASSSYGDGSATGTLEEFHPGGQPATSQQVSAWSQDPDPNGGGAAATTGGAGYPTTSDASQVAPPPSTPAANFGARNFQQDWETSRRNIQDGHFRQALEDLSKYYQSPDLSDSQHESLLDMLDALAGKVIYSTEPLLGDSLYLCKGGESLRTLAAQCNVPCELLQNVNGVRDPDVVPPGKQLKLVQGPFRAEVSKSSSQLTLFLGELYAGRFDVGFGNEPVEIGTFSVERKVSGGQAYDNGKMRIPAGHTNNPYGEHFLDLGRGMSIHGSPMAGTAMNMGCIGLAPRDAADVFGILSEGSTVRIRP